MVDGHLWNCEDSRIMKQRYIFPEMENAIRDYCLNCFICQQIKVDKSKRKGLLVNIKLPERTHGNQYKKIGSPNYPLLKVMKMTTTQFL